MATFRSDGAYSDGRRPDAVVFSSAREDALRRDFTINGMFFDPLENRLIDYVGGQDDLRGTLLRAIGDPAQRFDEDKLRMLRACAWPRASIWTSSRPPLRPSGDGPRDPRRQRRAHRGRAAQDARRSASARGMRLFMDLGLAQPILPELLPMRGLPQGLPRADATCLAAAGQPGPHAEGDHRPVGACPARARPLGTIAVVSAGVGRAACTTSASRAPSAGRRIATPSTVTSTSAAAWPATSALRLKLSNDEQERIEWLVEKHQFLATSARCGRASSRRC